MKRSVEKKEHLSTRLLLRQKYFALKIYLRSVLEPNRDATPVFLISSPRTGSSLLAGYMDHHPLITDCGEVLNQRIARGLNHTKFGPKPVVRHISRTIRSSALPVCLLKLHFNHLSDREASLVDVLDAFPAAKVIFLYRAALLEQYCSQKIATQTRQFVKKATGSSAVFNFNMADWRTYRSSQLAVYRKALRALRDSNRPFIKIRYEDLAANPQLTLERQLLPYLELSLFEVPPPPLRKQEKRPLGEIILNFHEIESQVLPHAEIREEELTI